MSEIQKSIKRRPLLYDPGGRDAESYGCALLFCSDDLEHWKWYDTVRTAKPFGYMWECPDLFEIDGQQIMTCCPQE